MFKILCTIIIMIPLCFLSHYSICQQETSLPHWVDTMYRENADIGQVLDLFEAYYEEHTFEKNEHTQYLKRWIHNISRDLSGAFNPRLTQQERRAMKTNQSAYELKARYGLRTGGGWIGLGPFDWDHEAASKSYAPGAAHMYVVEQSPSNPDILYAGAATAGLWKSIDHGQNWICMTRDMMVNSVYSLDIHPTNPSVVFAELLDNVYKTTDGGTNWSPTGDAAFQALSLDVLDIRFHPTDPDIVFAATDMGLYRTQDQGLTWTSVLSGKVQEIEIHPLNDSITYAVQQIGDITRFYRSSNIGQTFSQQTSGWPLPTTPDHNRRAEIAVSPDAPDKVFALLTGSVNGGSGLYGIYISHDQGSSWSFNCCGPQPGGLPDLSSNPPNINMMGWSDTGNDDGGQYYYDLSLAVSPTNADSIFVCGVNMWVSGDGGMSFSCPAKWSHSNKPNYVHADIHDIHYYENGEMWIACDGGIFYSDDNGANISRRMLGIEGSDFWGFGASYWNGSVMLGGAYHNGTLLKNDSFYINGWHCVDGGDGTGGFVNVGQDKRVYSNFNIKDLPNDRLTPIPTRGYAQKPYTHYIVGRSSNIAFHPENYSIQYFGKDDCLYMTTDDHFSASIIHCFGEAVADVEVSLLNPDYIYVATFPGHWDEKKIYKTTDGGQIWTDVTPGNSVFSTNRWLPYDITLSDEDPETLWIARVANSTASYDGQKVYKSTNGGLSWINKTTASLDGEQLSCMVYQRGSNEGLWIGTRRAVYYKSENLADWMLCNTDLPLSTFSTKLIINYRTQTIRNGTNRSVYEMPLLEPSTPKVQISVDKTSTACARDTFYFSDYSNVSEDGAVWDWSFPGAAYVSYNTSRNPRVVYSIPGTYDVSLSVGDVNGQDSIELLDFILVENQCNADTFPGNSLLCESAGDYATFNLDLATQNLTVTAWIKPYAIQPEYTGIFMGGISAAGFNFKNDDNTLAYHWPGGQWWWNSDLQVPVGEWSYVAMVANSEGMTLYLNGIADHHAISLDSAFYSSADIGSYYGWTSRNFNGELDEVTIWKRSLSQTEIREHMYITRDQLIQDPTPDSTLVAYYQFNETGGNIAFDRVGQSHASLLSGASRILSTVPVGGGSASTQSVLSSGSYSFVNEQINLHFAQNDHTPNGPLVVSKINWPPHQEPMHNTTNDRYWLIHSFGTNNSIIIDSLIIQDPILASYDCPDQFLFNRSFNAEGNSWGAARNPARSCSTNTLNFPRDTFNYASQIAIGHYDGNFYVDKQSQVDEGMSWETAFHKLQSAIHLAGTGDTVFVAQGTYYPRDYTRDCQNCSDNRQYSIHPRSGVCILGGFPSQGGELASRDWLNNPTIISGNINEDPALDVYHLLYIDSFSTNIEMDGLFFKNSRANGASVKDKIGSALLCHGGLKLKDIEFSAHVADNNILQIRGNSADVFMHNCLSINNIAGSLLLDIDEGGKLLMDEESVIVD